MRFRKYRLLLVALAVVCAFSCGKNTGSDEAEEEVTQTDVYRDVSPVIPTSQGFPVHRASIRGTVQPFNEAVLDSSLYLFIGRLYKAVLQKDAQYLLGVVDDDIKFSFGAENGRQDFIRDWGLRDKPDSSGIWPILKDVLEQGGGFSGTDRKLFMAPYYFVGWPDAYDAFDHGVIAGTGVRLRDKPAMHARIVKTLAYDIVKYEGNRTAEETRMNDESWPWDEVETLDGQKGWVYGKYFRSPIGYRIGIQRSGSGWKIVNFLAGD